MRFFVSFADQPAGGVGPTRRIHFSLEFPLISCGFSGFFFFKKKNNGSTPFPNKNKLFNPNQVQQTGRNFQYMWSNFQFVSEKKTKISFRKKNQKFRKIKKTKIKKKEIFVISCTKERHCNHNVSL